MGQKISQCGGYDRKESCDREVENLIKSQAQAQSHISCNYMYKGLQCRKNRQNNCKVANTGANPYKVANTGTRRYKVTITDRKPYKVVNVDTKPNKSRKHEYEAL